MRKNCEWVLKLIRGTNYVSNRNEILAHCTLLFFFLFKKSWYTMNDNKLSFLCTLKRKWVKLYVHSGEWHITVVLFLLLYHIQKHHPIWWVMTVIREIHKLSILIACNFLTTSWTLESGSPLHGKKSTCWRVQKQGEDIKYQNCAF